MSAFIVYFLACRLKHEPHREGIRYEAGGVAEVPCDAGTVTYKGGGSSAICNQPAATYDGGGIYFHGGSGGRL
jgi:hypothetical protein